MLLTEQERLRDDIRSIVEIEGNDRSALIPILQAIQKKYHYISSYAMQEISDLLGIHPVEVYGVVSFFSFLNEKPQGKFVIRLCETITCDMLGKDRVAKQLKNDLGIEFGETTKDGMFTLLYTSCLGMCDKGPAMLVNSRIYTQVTPQLISEILEECKKASYYESSQTEETH